LYLLNLIHCDRDSADEFTRLSSTKLQQISDEYKGLLDWAIECYIIETDSHLAGTQSKGYRFTKEYQTSLKEWKITRVKFIQKILKIYPKYESNATFQNPRLDDSGGNRYFFYEEKEWYTISQIADLLGLKPRVASKSLKRLGLIIPAVGYEFEVDREYVWYRYISSSRYGIPIQSLLYTSDAIEIIKFFKNLHPKLFPDKD